MNTDSNNNSDREDRSGSINLGVTIPAPFGDIRVPFYPASQEDVDQGTVVKIGWYKQGDATGDYNDVDAQLPHLFRTAYEAASFATEGQACNLFPDRSMPMPATLTPPAEAVAAAMLLGDKQLIAAYREVLHIVVVILVTPADDIPNE